MTFEEWWETEYRPTITDDELCIRPLKLHDLQAAWQAALRHAAEVCRAQKLDCVFSLDKIREDCAQAIEREAEGKP